MIPRTHRKSRRGKGHIALRFPHCREALQVLLDEIEQVSEPQPHLVRSAISAGLPKKDASILAAAIAAEVDLLVTGDKRHFGPLFGRRVEGLAVLPPADALALVLDRMEGSRAAVVPGE